MFREPRIGKRVAAISFDVKQNSDALAIGRVVALRRRGVVKRYAVQFDDGHIELFDADELYTKWEKGSEE